MSAAPKARVLCVDDEPMLLDSIALNLRRNYDVMTATSGPAALDIMAREPLLAVVMSDMRMPGMDGAAFLARARDANPDAVRMLLTGQADMTSAIAAVNDGQIFRFLTKPCAKEPLVAAVDAAVKHHELLITERVLLEQTLKGAVATLADVLALAEPALFGRANRIKGIVVEVADAMGYRDRWQLEVAAMMSRLGYIALPDGVCEKVDRGHLLSDAERKQVERVPAITERLLAHIPRLDGVRAILGMYARPPRREPGDTDPIRFGAHALHLAVELDLLESSGGPHDPFEVLAGRADCDQTMVNALRRARHEAGPRMVIKDVTIGGLRPGMILADDVKLATGALLVARGYEVTVSFLERLHNYAAGAVREPIRISVRV